MPLRIREPVKKIARAGALAVLCLSGCATGGAQNMREQAGIPRPEGVTEEGDHLVSVGCSTSRNPSMSRSQAQLRARGGLARSLQPGKRFVSADLTGSSVRRFFVNDQGHLCAEVEMAKPGK